VITIGVLVALALPVLAANVFAWRYMKALYLISRAQSRGMIALGAQLQEMLREQREPTERGLN
jgi:hypothetical protein